MQELAEGHVVVHNLIETNVNTPDAVLKLMQQGNKQRKVGGTSMNERSSRSHTIFRIIVESVPRDEADRSDAAVIVSHINLGTNISFYQLYNFCYNIFFSLNS